MNEGRQWVSTQLRNNTWSSVKSKKNVVRKTKVVCTIGPSSWDRESLFALADAGMNVARLNMSHGDHESHQKVIDLVKEYNSSGRGDTKVRAPPTDTTSLSLCWQLPYSQQSPFQ